MTDRETMLKLRVGSFVLAALVLFAACVLAVGGSSHWLEDRYTLRAAFRSAEGLMVGAQVRLAGVTVGQVTRIGFGPDPADKRIVVELGVDRRFQAKIREDSVATISTIGVVGDKDVEISVGSQDRQPLGPQAFVASLDPPDYTTLLQRSAQIVASLNQVTTAITQGRGLLHALAYDPKGEKMLGDLAQAAADLKQTTGKLTRGEGTLGALLDDPSVYENLSNLLHGADRSWILRSLIRSSVRRGESGK